MIAAFPAVFNPAGRVPVLARFVIWCGAKTRLTLGS